MKALSVWVDATNGLSARSVVSCDNITTIPAEALRDQIGVLLDDQEPQLSAAIHAASTSIETSLLCDGSARGA